MSLNLLNSSVIDYDTYHIDNKKGKCLYFNQNKANITSTEFIETTNIKCSQYTWAKYDKTLNKYIKCTKTVKSSMLFIKEEWIKKNIPQPPVEPRVEVTTKPLSPQLPITQFYSPQIVNVVEPVIVSIINEENVIEVVSAVQPEFSKKLVPEPITFYEGNGEEIRKGLFFLAGELQKFNPEFFYGMKNSTHIREIVDLKKIPETDVAYGSLIKNKGWCIRSDEGVKAKLFLTKEWVDTYFWKRTAEQITVMTQYEYAPPKVYISDDMIFKDCDGNDMNIEVHAIFNEDEGLNRRETYFTVASVSEGFGLPNLHTTLLNDKSKFKEEKHYKYMFCTGDDLLNLQNAPSTESGNTNKQVKTMFLTWNGLMNVMYSKASGNPNIDSFQEWADNILFTHKFGSKKDKQILASELLGYDMDTLTSIINSHASPISCIYAFTIGTVGDLRKRYNIPDNIPDDHLVLKFGYTAKLKDRTTAHMNTYGANIKFFIHERIYSCHLREAENDLKLMLRDKILNDIKKTTMTDDNGVIHTCKGENELFTMENTKCEIEEVKKYYSTIGNRYSQGALVEIKGEINVINKELECVKHYSTVVENISQERIKDLQLTANDLRLALDDTRETNKDYRAIIRTHLNT